MNTCLQVTLFKKKMFISDNNLHHINQFCRVVLDLSMISDKNTHHNLLVFFVRKNHNLFFNGPLIHKLF